MEDPFSKFENNLGAAKMVQEKTVVKKYKSGWRVWDCGLTFNCHGYGSSGNRN